MARFLMAVWPFDGHYFPLIAIAHALRKRNHEVAFYTGTKAQATVEAEGFVCFPFQQIDEARIDQIMFSRSIYSNRQRPGQLQALLREWLLGTVPAQVEDLTAVLAAWQPDVLISETSMLAPMLVLHETHSIPVAVFSTLAACILPGRDAPPYGMGLPRPRTLPTQLLSWFVQKLVDSLGIRFRRQANELRRRYHLPPLAVSVTQRTAQMPLYLVPSVPAFDYEREDLPSSVHYIGPCLWQRATRPSSGSEPPLLPADRPLIHVSEGTMHTQRPLLLRAATQGLSDLPVHVIMSTGGNRDPHELDLGPGAGNIQVVKWVSHAELLPKCSVVVTTGGAGTVMAVLAAGVPLVIVPTEWDKPENAQRVVEAGAGIRISPRQCTPEQLRSAVKQILSDPSYRQNAERLAAILNHTDGPEQAAVLLEPLASTSLPERVPAASFAEEG